MKLTAFGWSTILLACTSLPASAKKPDPSSFVGINLGPTYLTSVYAASSKDKVLSPVAKVKASKAYRDYVANSIDNINKGTPGGHADGPAQAILLDALSSIKKATEEKLDFKTVTIGSISRPLYFNESTTNALAAAAKQLNCGFIGKATSATNAARMAHGLYSCQGFGMNASSCDINDGEHSVVLLDYNAEYLELAVGYVNAERCEVRGYKLIRELGENHIFEPTYHEQLQKVFAEFQGTYFGIFDFWDYSAHVRGVILSGDASKVAIDEMRKAMAEAYPTLKNRFKDGISPDYMAASGAARLAQIEAQIEKMKSYVQDLEEDDDLEDDEEIHHIEL